MRFLTPVDVVFLMHLDTHGLPQVGPTFVVIRTCTILYVNVVNEVSTHHVVVTKRRVALFVYYVIGHFSRIQALSVAVM